MIVACLDAVTDELNRDNNCYGFERVSAGTIVYTGLTVFDVEEHAGQRNEFAGLSATRDQQSLDWTHFSVSLVDSVALTEVAIVAASDGVSPMLVTTGTLDFEQASEHRLMLRIAHGSTSIQLQLMLQVSDRVGPSYTGDLTFFVEPGSGELKFYNVGATDADGVALDWTEFGLFSFMTFGTPPGLSIAAASASDPSPVLVVDRSNPQLQLGSSHHFLVLYTDTRHDEGVGTTVVALGVGDWAVQSIVLNNSGALLESGASVSITVGTANLGNDTAAATELRLRLHPVQTSALTDAPDPSSSEHNQNIPGYLGSVRAAESPFCEQSVAARSASASPVGVSLSCTLPTDILPDQEYVLVACLDAVANEPDTSSNTNNCYGVERKSSATDMAVQSFALNNSGALLVPGASLPVTVGVANVGSFTVPTTTLQLRLHRAEAGDASFDDHSISGYPGSTRAAKSAFCTQSVPSLSAGGQLDSLLTCSLPANLVANTDYLLVACLDADDAESNELNNCYGRVRRSAATDWAVQSMALNNNGALLTPGAAVTITVGVDNVSPFTAPATTLRLRLHTAQSLSEHNQNIPGYIPGYLDSARAASESVFCEQPVAAQSVSASPVSVSLSCTLPTAIAPAQEYVLVACLDAAASESKDNNCYGVERNSDRPDMAVQSFALNNSGALLVPGASLPVTVEVANVGRFTVPATTLQLRLHDAPQVLADNETFHDQVLPHYLSSADASQSAFCTGSVAEQAASAGPVSVSLSCTLPSSLTPAKKYLLVACADLVTDETNDANNCYGFERNSDVPPDLVVQALALANSGALLEAGQTLAVTATVANESNWPVAASTLSLRLHPAQTPERGRAKYSGLPQ